MTKGEDRTIHAESEKDDGNKDFQMDANDLMKNRNLKKNNWD